VKTSGAIPLLPLRTRGGGGWHRAIGTPTRCSAVCKTQHRGGVAREYGKHNITANCIGAGGIESEEAEGGLSFPPGTRDPINRWGKPEEIAFLAVSLASEEAGYVTGQCVMANGGRYFL
jgi:enoyl-[acyl-carrier-protein] reductase (NADH)